MVCSRPRIQWSALSLTAAPRQEAARPPSVSARRGTFAGSSLDYLVRPQQQRLRNRQPEGLGGLEIDDQLELRGLLHRKIRRFRAPEDFVHISGRTPGQVQEMRTVGHVTTRIDVIPQV